MQPLCFVGSFQHEVETPLQYLDTGNNWKSDFSAGGCFLSADLHLCVAVMQKAKDIGVQ